MIPLLYQLVHIYCTNQPLLRSQRFPIPFHSEEYYAFSHLQLLTEIISTYRLHKKTGNKWELQLQSIVRLFAARCWVTHYISQRVIVELIDKGLGHISVYWQ